MRVFLLVAKIQNRNLYAEKFLVLLKYLSFLKIYLN